MNSLIPSVMVFFSVKGTVQDLKKKFSEFFSDSLFIVLGYNFPLKGLFNIIFKQFSEFPDT